MKKRIISLFTSIAIAFTMFFGFPTVKAEALTCLMSADEAINWINQHYTNGQKGGQCMAFVNQYIHALCGRYMNAQTAWCISPKWETGSNYDHFGVFSSSTYPFTFIKGNSGMELQKGDILLYHNTDVTWNNTCACGQDHYYCGHIAIYESDSKWYDSNGRGDDEIFRVRTTSPRWSSLYGVLRPNFIDPVTYPNVPDVPTYAVTNNVYQLRCAGGPGYQANVYGGADQNGTSVCTWEFDGSNEQLFRFYHENSGKYWIYAMCSSGGTNRVLDVNVGADGALNIGDGIDLWTRGGYDDCQMFNVVPIGGNKYILELAALDNAVIGITEHANGKQLTLQRYTGSDSQHWYLVDPNVEGTYSPKACTHNYIESISRQATCTQTGVRTKICTWCSSVINEDISKISHNYSSSWTTDVYPTCTAAGSKSHHCTMCSAKWNITSIPALGHNWDGGKTTKNATCTSVGTLVKTCTRCQAKTYADIPMISHNYSSSWTIDIYPTCTAAGSKSHHCTMCSAKWNKTSIPALGHSWDGGKITKNPTYTSVGTIVYTCTACSAVKSENIPMLNKLPAPQNLKAAAGEKKITLTWSAVSGAKKYRVQRYNGSAWLTTAIVSTTSYTNTGLADGVQYKYRVLASADGKTWGQASAVAGAVTIKKVSAPVNLKAVPSSGSVKLTWSAVSGAKKYRVQRYNGVTWITVNTTSASAYTDVGLKNRTQYRYRVLASADGSVWSSASAVVAAVPAAKLAAPSNIRAVPANRSIKLTWSAVSGAKKYRIQRYNGSAWATIATVSTLSYTNTGLTNGAQYKYRILASADGSSWGSASAAIAAIPRA